MQCNAITLPDICQLTFQPSGQTLRLVALRKPLFAQTTHKSWRKRQHNL